MLQPRRLLVPTAVVLLLVLVESTSELTSEFRPRDGDRGRREVPDVTTVLLVGGGRFQDKPEGLLTSTARTFVQEGTTTEYATQVLGTRLDHGRVYAQVLSTSSRVFFDGRDLSRKPPPSLPPYLADIVRPTLVFPVQQPVQTQETELPFGYTKAGQLYHTQVTSLLQSKFARTGDVITVSAIEPEEAEPETLQRPDNHFAAKDNHKHSANDASGKSHPNKNRHTGSNENEQSDNLLKAKKMDLFNKRNVDKQKGSEAALNDLKPAKVVRPLDELPTLTVRHDFSPSGFSAFGDDAEPEDSQKKEYSSSRVRGGKALYRAGLHKPELKKLDTVTYMGFADFTTTVGDTVIVFMPNTATARHATGYSHGRKATSITGAATLPPTQQRTSDSIRVVTSVKTFMSHSPGMVTRTVTGHSISMQTALPTMVVLPETPPPHSGQPRAHKGLDPVYVVEAVTEQEDEKQDEPEHTEEQKEHIKTSFLAYEQELFVKAPEQDEQDTEAQPQLEHIEPSINVDDLEVSSIQYEIPETTDSSVSPYVESHVIEPSSPIYELPDVIQPSEVVTEPVDTPVTEEEYTEVEPIATEEYVPTATTPLESYRTAQTQLIPTDPNGDPEFPQGLIKVIGGTEIINGTTTLFTSLVYGTTVENGYAHVIHSTSSIFYHVGESKVNMEVPKMIEPTTTIIHTYSPIASKEVTTTQPVTVFNHEESIIATTEDNSLSTLPLSTTENSEQFGTTGGEKAGTTFQDDTLSTLPMEETTTHEIEISNEVETGRKINGNSKDQVIVEQNDSSTATPKYQEAHTSPKTEDHPKDTETGTTVPEISSSTPKEATEGEIVMSSGGYITRLVPTTVYKTFTHLTTFFIPLADTTTTSIKSHEVISSDVSLVTRIVNATVHENNGALFTTAATSEIAPSKVQMEGSLKTFETMTSTTSVTSTEDKPETTTSRQLIQEEDEPKSSQQTASEESVTTPTMPTTTEDEGVELIYKTLYTTYTYLTTYFEESTTSISSHEVVVTNVMTSTVGQDFFLHASDPAVAGLFARDDDLVLPSETISPAPTSVGIGRPTEKYFPDIEANLEEDLFSSVIDSVDIDKEIKATPSLVQDLNVIKTFYTTYTYFTTIFVDGETTVSSRTEVYTNVVSPSSIQPTATSSIEPTLLVTPNTPNILSEHDEPLQNHIQVPNVLQETPSFKPTPKLEDSSTITRDNHKIIMNEIDDSAEVISSKPIIGIDVDNTVFKNTAKYESEYATISRVQNEQKASSSVTKSPITSREVTPQPESVAQHPEVIVQSMSTDVRSSSSEGDAVTMEPLEDQISSESNTEELHPSPTLLLQTSFTTFTYFTTIYKGSTSSDIISRLETVTNVVTETISPHRTILPSNTVILEEAALPVTYFTTYTYWTTLYKEGTTLVTSREDTISNVVPPSVASTPTSSTEVAPTATPKVLEPTTYYTTFTYFTTSYIGNSTILNSRLETITTIVNGSDTAADDLQAGRAIGSSVVSQHVTEAGNYKTEPPAALPTGLLSTFVSTAVNDGTTTVFSTDVYGAYIDGLYANVLESTTQIITPTPTPTPVINTQPTGIVSLNEGHIIDADGVSTIFFTTHAIGTFIDNLYAQVVTSMTSLNVDTARQSELLAASPSTDTGSKFSRTGLVRLIEGTIVKDQTTTFYESKVIGTVIDGRYAQVIESTSSFKVAVSPTAVPTEITSTSTPGLTVTSTAAPYTTPGSVVIESSITEDEITRKKEEEEEQGENNEEDGEDEKNAHKGSDKSRIKSRITFNPPKKTFTPHIRPFSSRNRPTFNPSRRKPPAADSATTITRTKLTPTIIATPAAKPGRFNGNRRTSSSFHGSSSDARSSASSSTRRYNRGRNGSTTGAYHSSSYGGARGRTSNRISPTTTSGPAGSSKRGGYYRSSSVFRSSSALPGRGSSSSGYLGGRPSRFQVRPTQVNSRLPLSTGYTTPSIDETVEPDNEFATTLMTEETPQYAEEEFETPTLPLPTTTESSRRINPLLRFRRPPLTRGPQSVSSTSKPSTSPTKKSTTRGNNNKVTTTPRPPPRSRPTPNNRYSPISNRPRPSGGLFPPRGLFKRPEPEEIEEETESEEENPEEQEDTNTNDEGHQDEEEDIGDNDYEGSERKEAKTSANRKLTPYKPVQIKPFLGFNRRARTKRQASRETGTATRSYSSRFRRPGTSNNRKPNHQAAQERVDVEEEPLPPPDPPKSKSNGRYSHRSRTQPQQSNTPRLKPSAVSPSSSRSQFTLRENKDSTASTRSSYRRSSNTAARRRPSKTSEPTATVTRPKPPRLRGQHTETSSSHTRNPSRVRNIITNTSPSSRRSGKPRTRSRSETSDTGTYSYSPPTFDGTITVTHHIPTEVTIPVVNGKVTEYRGVVTASASTEVLGPHQYTTTFGKDGNTLLMLTSEVTGTLPGGVTEVTQFLLHETPTTSVIFTPTTIRGRKTSFSHPIPSTVYEVEQVVNTIRPQIAPNAPLANILLSQLLLGNLGGLQPNLNPLLALNNAAVPPPTPTTEYKTRATTYVTTVTKGTSTVIPLTFRGKEILTTIVDSSEEVITATEFITDTVVITPTATLAANQQLNSLLLPALLQAQLLGTQGAQGQQANANPLLAGLQHTALAEQTRLFPEPQKIQYSEPENDEPISVEQEKTSRKSHRRQRPSEETERHSRESEGDLLQEEPLLSSQEDDSWKPPRKKIPRGDRKPPDPPQIPAETSVVTLYVSGRRPGEFSTLLSTVTVGEESNIRKRDVTASKLQVETSDIPLLGTSFPDTDVYVMSAMNDIAIESSEAETQSLESIVGDVSRHLIVDRSSSRNFGGRLSLTSGLNGGSYSSKRDSSDIANTSSVSENRASQTSNQPTGHFLSDGAAELAPLKHKGASLFTRGQHTQENIIPASLQRRKRSESDNDEDTNNMPKPRKRIRIRVPIHRKSASNENEKEVLSLSEAQQTDRVTDMELFSHQSAKRPAVSLADYGMKLTGNQSSMEQDGNSERHRKRIIVTRRRKPLPDRTPAPVFNASVSREQSSGEKETKIPKANNTRRRVVVTKKRPVPTTPSTTRRRVVVTKKRPLAQKTADQEHITPTPVIEVPVSTVYLRKYSLLNRVKPVETVTTKKLNAAPRFMSGNIPTAFRIHVDDDDDYEEHTTFGDSEKTTQVHHETSIEESTTEAAVKGTTEEPLQFPAISDLEYLYKLDKNLGEDESNKPPTIIDNETEQSQEKPSPDTHSETEAAEVRGYDETSEINDEENMTDRDEFRSTTLSMETGLLTSAKRDHKHDSPIISIIPFIARPSPSKSYDDKKVPSSTLIPTQEVTYGLDVVIEDTTLTTNERESSTAPTTLQVDTTQGNADTTAPTTEVAPEDDKTEITTRGTADYIEPPETTSTSADETTPSMEHGDHTVQDNETTTPEEVVTEKMEEIKEETTTAPEESVIVTTPESTYEGPRFIRPTRFSITRRPSRTRASFRGQNRRTYSTTTTPSTQSPFTSTKTQRSRRPSPGLFKYRSKIKPSEPFSPATSSTIDLTTSSRLLEPTEFSPTTEPVEITKELDTTVLLPKASDSTTPSPMEPDVTTPLTTELYPDTGTQPPESKVTSADPETTTSLPTDSDVTPPVPTESNVNVSPLELSPPASSTAPVYQARETALTPQYVTRTVTRTRLRTYTYIVTRVAGTEQLVTSTTEVKPHVTTTILTQTLPAQKAAATDMEPRGLTLSPNEARYNLATKVMSNGVEVIVAGDKSTLPGEPDVLRVLSSSTQRPTTLAPSTVTDHMMLLLPQVTQTFLTTYTFLTTFVQDGSTSFSSREHVETRVSTGTSSGPSEVHLETTVSSTVSERPLTTDVVNTYFVTYTYYSTFLEGGSTVVRSEVATSSEVMTEKFYLSPKRTSSTTLPIAPTPAPQLDVSPTKIDRPLYVFATKTYLTTYTYFTTLLQDAGHDKTSTIISSRTRVEQNIVTDIIPPSLLGSDYLLSVQSSLQAGTPMVAMATMVGGQSMTITAMESQHTLKPTSTLEAHQVTPSATISSSMEEQSSNINNIITGSTIIFFDEEDQMDPPSSSPTASLAIDIASEQSKTPTPALTIQNTAIDTGATIVTAQALTSTTGATTQQVSIETSILPTSTVTASGATLKPGDQVIMITQSDGSVTMIPLSDPANTKKPGSTIGPGGSEIQVSDLLSLGSLGINGFNALGPVINAMAGLIQSNLQETEVHRRNDSRPAVEEPPRPVYVPAVHSPVYIPVGGIAGDSEAAESQNYEGVANLNGDKIGWKLQGDDSDAIYPDTQMRHRPPAPAEPVPVVVGRPTLEKPLLGDGIPISPGEVITANSDVIVGKPAILGPRPPKVNAPIGMRPPPLPSPAWDKPSKASLLVDVRPSQAATLHMPEHDPAPFPVPENSPEFVGIDGDPTSHVGGNKDHHKHNTGSFAGGSSIHHGENAGSPIPIQSSQMSHHKNNADPHKPHNHYNNNGHQRPHTSGINILNHSKVKPGFLKPGNTNFSHHNIPLKHNLNFGPANHHGGISGTFSYNVQNTDHHNYVPLEHQEVDLNHHSAGHQKPDLIQSYSKPPTDIDHHGIEHHEFNVSPNKINAVLSGNHGISGSQYGTNSANHHAIEVSSTVGSPGSLNNHKVNSGSVNHHILNTESSAHHKLTNSHSNHRPDIVGSLGHHNVNIGSAVSHNIDVIVHPGSFNQHASSDIDTLKSQETEIHKRPHHNININGANKDSIQDHATHHHGHNINVSPGNQHLNQQSNNALTNTGVDTESHSPAFHSLSNTPLGHHSYENHHNLGFVENHEPDEDPLAPHGIGTVLDVPKDTGTRMDPPPPDPTGVNVEVTPGQGFHVEISPGHVQQHGISEHISPSGIVLDVPLASRPHRPARPHSYSGSPSGHRLRPLPQRPMEFMTPPPLPLQPVHVHFGGGNGPVIIPLNPNSPQMPRPRPEELLITNHHDKDDHDESVESINVDDGEVVQASNSRPVHPGQLPGKPFTHRPEHEEILHLPKPDEKPQLHRPRPPTIAIKPRPRPSGFIHHQPAVPENHRPSRPELELSKLDESSHLILGQKPPNIEEKPQAPNFENNYHTKPLQNNKPSSAPAHSSGVMGDGLVAHENVPHPPRIEVEMAAVDRPPKPPKPLFDLETQANTPRPYIRPPNLDTKPDDSVMGLSPPPPNIAVSSNSGIRFPGIDDSTHRPVVNIRGEQRPTVPSRNKPKPLPSLPYNFEIITTEPSTTADYKPRPPLYEIPGPSNVPVKEQETAEQNAHNTAVPITTHRPRVRPRPRPPSTTTSSPEVVFIGKPKTTPLPTRENSVRKPASVHPSTPPTRIGTPVFSPSSVRETVANIHISTFKHPIIMPSSVHTTTKTPALITHPVSEVTGSEIVLKEDTKHKPQIINAATNIQFSDHTVIVSSGSKTIFGAVFTKPSTEALIPTQTLPNELLKTSLVGNEYKDESIVPVKDHSKVEEKEKEEREEEEEEEEEDDITTALKNDLGVSSSNDETIIFDEELIPTQYVTHTQTLTVTTTETTVLSSEGHQPSTFTVVLTKTQTSTIVDTVTETQTLVKPTSVVATVTTTVSATTTAIQYAPGSPFNPENYPTYPSHSTATGVTASTSSVTVSTSIPTSTSATSTTSTEQENESLFVVVNDQRPGSGDDANDIDHREEADGVNHAVLLGGVLVAVPPKHNGGLPPGSSGSSCRPDCSPARNELCQRMEGHMRCVCRPGFARMFPDRPCKPTYTYSMRLTLGQLGQEQLQYEPALNEPGAPRFQQLAEASRQGLDRMVMQSDLRDVFHGVAVNGFQPSPRQDGVVVNFYVQLSDNTDETRLKDVFRKSLRTSNYSLGGTQLYADKEQVTHLQAEDFDECESPHFHDCSENARCFNLRGTYTCSCKEGYADLSENKLFPGRVCSAELVGCEKCHYHGTCYSRGDDQLLCECFQWYAGENCHINLKVLLIALVTIGAILLALLLACILLTWLKRGQCRQQPRTPGFLRYRGPPRTLDKRAMILDTSSEGSVDNIPPMSYMTPTQPPASTFSSKAKQQQNQHQGTLQSYSEQRDRSLTVMIPRAKYRPVPPTSPLLTMSTFGAEEKRAIAQEQKLLAMLEAGKQPQDTKSNSARKKQSTTSGNQPTESAAPRKASAPRRPSAEPAPTNTEAMTLPPGALVSAGFEVSATVGKRGANDSDTETTAAAMNTLASHGSNFTTLRTADSCEGTDGPVSTAKTPEKEESSSKPTNRSGVEELTVSEARSCDETTIQPPTRRLHSNYGSKPSSRNLNNDEAHTMAERDVGSTFLMPQTHLYKPDRGSDISNFDSL